KSIHGSSGRLSKRPRNQFSFEWLCELMIPGTTAKREQSTSSFPDAPSPTDAMRPPSIATSVRRKSPPPTSTRPFFSTMSVIRGRPAPPGRPRRRLPPPPRCSYWSYADSRSGRRHGRRRAGREPGDARDVDHRLGRHLLVDHDTAEAEQLPDPRR